MSQDIEMANMLKEVQTSIMQWHFNQLKEYITKQLDDVHEKIQELKETMDIKQEDEDKIVIMGNKATNMSFFQLKPQGELTLIANVGLVHNGVFKVNLIH